jgi:hypothetical protein
MVNTYQLVNPFIQGKFKSTIKAKNSVEAANIFYKTLSEHFNNSVPQFNFTIHKGSSGNGNYYHFQVQENRNKEEVSFSIEPLQLKNAESAVENFKSRLSKFKSKFAQDGGKKDKKHRRKHKKHDSDDSSDSESSDNFYKKVKSYVPVNQPIYYWWYDPYVYSMDYVYIPTFYSYVTPYIELNLNP